MKMKMYEVRHLCGILKMGPSPISRPRIPAYTAEEAVARFCQQVKEASFGRMNPDPRDLYAVEVTART